jgi:hypothetical protein
MDLPELLGFSAGVGLLAGIRLYATVLAAGLAIRFHWITLGQNYDHLNILAAPAVLIAAGIAGLIELTADKIAWLDSIWDAFHTLLRPAGAVLLGAAAFSSVDPQLRIVLILVCGGMALTSHASKAATRILVNHSPEPFSNVAVSAVEDVLQAAGVWLVLQHPLITLGLTAAFLVAFVWLFRKILAILRRRFGPGRREAAARA